MVILDIFHFLRNSIFSFEVKCVFGTGQQSDVFLRIKKVHISGRKDLENW